LITKLLLSSLISFTIPVPFPVSSTLAFKIKSAGILIGISRDISPLSEPSISISVKVKA